MKSGILKSGSPRLKPITSFPDALNSLAFAAIANVCDVAKFLTLSDKYSSIILRLSKIIHSANY